MALWWLVAVAVILLVVYFMLPGKKPTINIKSFPRKYPDEKVGAV